MSRSVHDGHRSGGGNQDVLGCDCPQDWGRASASRVVHGVAARQSAFRFTLAPTCATVGSGPSTPPPTGSGWCSSIVAVPRRSPFRNRAPTLALSRVPHPIQPTTCAQSGNRADMPALPQRTQCQQRCCATGATATKLAFAQWAFIEPIIPPQLHRAVIQYSQNQGDWRT